MLKIAHLIFVHKNPLQVERLVKKLISERADIYIHVDKKVSINQFYFSESFSNVFYIKNRVTVNWGNYSMVKAMLSSLQEVILSYNNYSHVNLLSGQDYPLQPLEKFETFLLENKGQTFMQYLSIHNQWEDAKQRLTHYNLGDWKVPGKYKIQKLLNTYFPSRKFTKHLEPFGGSSWFMITPECIQYVLEYLKNNPGFTSFFKYMWAADEIIFQTVLINSHLKDIIVNENFRFIEFKNKSPHPTFFTKKDFEILVNSGKYFARKFSTDIDTEILDFLDQRIA